MARNAFEVMMRRNWSPMLACQPDHNDEDQWGWKVFSGRKNGYVGSDPTRLYPDPFTALVDADRWYRENVEAAK